jgi:serine protease SohB
MEYLFDYAVFAAKLITVAAVIAIPVIIGLVLVQSRRRHSAETAIEIRKLNDKFSDTSLALESVLMQPKEFKKRVKQVRKENKVRRESPEARTRLFVCEFTGDIRANAVSALREEITAILSVAVEGDEVAVVLESSGGTVHGYGLAASQLRRIRDKGFRLTVIVDKIAASGGYMMACVADEIIAAPFAIVGSIGVIAQLPNFNRLLKKHDIDFEQIAAGRYKRTLTLFGENTDADREKYREEIEEAHTLFKQFVAAQRPALDLERTATGEHWFGTRALELGLIDRISTSDDFLCAKAADVDVFQVTGEVKKSIIERILGPSGTLFS